MSSQLGSALIRQASSKSISSHHESSKPVSSHQAPSPRVPKLDLNELDLSYLIQGVLLKEDSTPVEFGQLKQTFKISPNSRIRLLQSDKVLPTEAFVSDQLQQFGQKIQGNYLKLQQLFTEIKKITKDIRRRKKQIRIAEKRTSATKYISDPDKHVLTQVIVEDRFIYKELRRERADRIERLTVFQRNWGKGVKKLEILESNLKDTKVSLHMTELLKVRDKIQVFYGQLPLKCPGYLDYKYSRLTNATTFLLINRQDIHNNCQTIPIIRRNLEKLDYLAKAGNFQYNPHDKFKELLTQKANKRIQTPFYNILKHKVYLHCQIMEIKNIISNAFSDEILNQKSRPYERQVFIWNELKELLPQILKLTNELERAKISGPEYDLKVWIDNFLQNSYCSEDIANHIKAYCYFPQAMTDFNHSNLNKAISWLAEKEIPVDLTEGEIVDNFEDFVNETGGYTFCPQSTPNVAPSHFASFTHSKKCSVLIMGDGPNFKSVQTAVTRASTYISRRLKTKQKNPKISDIAKMVAEALEIGYVAHLFSTEHAPSNEASLSVSIKVQSQHKAKKTYLINGTTGSSSTFCATIQQNRNGDLIKYEIKEITGIKSLEGIQTSNQPSIICHELPKYEPYYVLAVSKAIYETFDPQFLKVTPQQASGARPVASNTWRRDDEQLIKLRKSYSLRMFEETIFGAGKAIKKKSTKPTTKPSLDMLCRKFTEDVLEQRKEIWNRIEAQHQERDHPYDDSPHFTKPEDFITVAGFKGHPLSNKKKKAKKNKGKATIQLSQSSTEFRTTHGRGSSQLQERERSKTDEREKKNHLGKPFAPGKPAKSPVSSPEEAKIVVPDNKEEKVEQNTTTQSNLVGEQL